MNILGSVILFILAGLCEIGGGYLVWLWLREERSFFLGGIGGMVLMLYGVVPTFQPEPNFGRIYAAYGGVFVIMSVLWGWKIDGKTPDAYDLVGALTCGVGIIVIMWGRNFLP